MGRVGKTYYSQKLDDLLSKASDEEFCQLVWSVDALQSERVEAASKFVTFPPQAAVPNIASEYAIYKWELETLITRLLSVPKQHLATRRLNCGVFNAAALVTKHLRKLENAESGLYLKRFGIFNELHRIGQRQFPWQRGYFNTPQFVRYAYIYNHGQAKSYFEQSHHLSINDFSLIGFGLYWACSQNPWIHRSFSFKEIGLRRETVEAGLKLLSIGVHEAQKEATAFMGEKQIPTAYRKSLLRQHPIIAFNEKQDGLIAPLPQLILLRVTAGVFYDLVGGPSSIRNEASARFEQYSLEFMRAMMPSFDVRKGERYLKGGNTIEAPDILVSEGGQLTIVIECKARRLSFDAQFGEDPVKDAQQGYTEMGKGVFQLWRYFSHLRRGIVPNTFLTGSAHGVVLTLDPWLTMSEKLREHVESMAHRQADADDGITAEDRRPVIFCSIADFELVIRDTDEREFLRVLMATREARFRNWLLPGVSRDLGVQRQSLRPFPISVGTVLPWWDTIPGMRVGDDTGK